MSNTKKMLTKALAALVVGVASFTAAPTPLPHAPGLAFRAFSPGSYWNRPLADATPVDPRSDAMIRYLKRDSAYPHIRLVGTESDGGWGEPVYWALPTDPVYKVKSTRYSLPDEFESLRIPPEARPAATADAQMTIYDLAGGGVYKLWQARYDAATDTWSAGGGAYYYLRSNGLHGSLPESDESRNIGHRGVPPALHTVRFDEVQAGSIDHVLKISIDTPSTRHVWPMVGSDGDSTKLSAPPQGARLRIKPEVDLTELDLSPGALVVARALQRYGAVIGDSSGAPAALKLENTVAEGRGQLWSGVLTVDALRAIPFDDFEFVALGERNP